mmetsp:Transcript_26609/g.48216  ORF Transcript_26609/g.48216 Transcript_26609/m.48216 type:complete len:83 (+) Transcript_26609:247-495(+)
MGISSPEIADHNICFIFMFFIFMREYHLRPCLLCWRICEEEGAETHDTTMAITAPKEGFKINGHDAPLKNAVALGKGMTKAT